MINPFLSIVVPVYNTPISFLEANINSILSQDGNLEIIYINDGSTKEWIDRMLVDAARKDSRVVYINKKNSGVSDTRNEGIKNAHGQYIMFVDSDDTLFDNCIIKCCESARDSGADIILFGVGNFPKASRIRKLLDNSEKENMLLATLSYHAEDYIKQGVSIDGPVAKFIRTNMIKDNGILFPLNIARAEDAIFDAYCYEHANKILIDNFDVYNIVCNPESLTKSYRYELVQMIPHYLEEEKKFVEKYYPNSRLFFKALQYRTFTGIMEVVYSYFEVNPEKKTAMKIRKEFINLMRHPLVHSCLKEISKTDLKILGYLSFFDYVYLRSFQKASYLIYLINLKTLRLCEALVSSVLYKKLRNVN